MTPLVAYVLLFVAVGVGFIFVHLMAGKFIRPNKPEASKRTIYECGEPTIGSAWVQFDVRFYVVALLFVIFDVEVAFFFPWAEVFGKANALAAIRPPTDAESFHEAAQRIEPLIPPSTMQKHAPQLEGMAKVTPEGVALQRELEAKRATNQLSSEEARQYDSMASKEFVIKQTRNQGRTLAWMSLLEIVVFFGVLLVGYAYLWRRGDLAWVRSLAAERPGPEAPGSVTPPVVRQAVAAPLAAGGTHS